MEDKRYWISGSEVCINSMGNLNLFALFCNKSSHLCNCRGYKHGFGLNLQLNNCAIF